MERICTKPTDVSTTACFCTNLTVPVLTIEVQGADFVALQSSICPVGKNVYLGLRQSAHEALACRKFIRKEGYADTFDRLSHL
uniref:Uncharacterized protein n=1 Tax=Peronospora matthiolae TaxID=2874970 RepID=A0AAV1T5E2_9STRA